MRLNYDQEADALMISLRDGIVARSEEIDNGTILDLNERGELLGIEVIRPARRWPLAEILAKHRISDADSQTLRKLWESNERHYPFVRESVPA